MKEGIRMLCYEYMLKQYEQIESKLLNIEKTIARLPEGKICCTQNGASVKWYVYVQSEKIYLKKRNRRLAEGLAYKKYLMKIQKELQQEKIAIEKYLKYSYKQKNEADKLLDKDSYYRDLILPYYRSINEKIATWQNSDYEKNENYPEQLTQPSISGNTLRSKSEEKIDSALFKAKIPFRYECALQLGNKTIYPDFTIIHPETGKIYYWEHFGIMDDVAYARNAFSKMNLYYSNGIVPSINLIMTFETKETPLSNITVEKIIEQYFI